tara:strand:- start:4042 stop:5115 length:1074 start_codon:yes stop_codon:yes gene_type:complete
MLNNLNYFRNKKVLITGHTGFKGSWLVFWLNLYGAKIVGISKNIPTNPSNFVANKIHKKCKNFYYDINDKKIKKIINNFEPHFIFHLAAQAIVSTSYQNPKETWKTNVFGTLNLLETIKDYKKKCTIVIVTSDKCYLNLEKKSGYSELDQLGGYDHYSASKASMEILYKAYYNSFLKKNKSIRIASARAGNVIGGGDWAKDRLIPDAVRKWNINQKIIIRNKKSTRPWQHVFDALYGYIELAIKLEKNKSINGESFNFGPNNMSQYSVENILKIIKKYWKKANWINQKKKIYKETHTLNLKTHKAKKILKWSCKLSFEKNIFLLTSWYKNYYENRKQIEKISLEQIRYYEKLINKGR